MSREDSEKEEDFFEFLCVSILLVELFTSLYDVEETK